jgi:hypothetical protein
MIDDGRQWHLSNGTYHHLLSFVERKCLISLRRAIEHSELQERLQNGFRVIAAIMKVFMRDLELLYRLVEGIARRATEPSSSKWLGVENKDRRLVLE